MIIYKFYSVTRVKKWIKNQRKKNITHGPNIVNRNWGFYEKNKYWLTDISYISLNNKFEYLSVIKNVKTRFIVSHNSSLVNDLKIYKDTLIKAQKYREDIYKLLIPHSDKGIQYTSFFSKQYAKKHNITISLSRPGNSIDNAMCETFFSSLKEKWKVELKVKTFNELEKVINNYVNFYNSKE